MDLQIEYFNDGTAFYEIEPLSINPEYLTNFSIYERTKFNGHDYKFRCLLVDSSSMPEEKLIKLLKSWKSIYIHESQIENYKQYLKNNLSYILNHDEIDISKKTNTLIDLTTDVIEECFQADFLISRDQDNMLGEVEKLISQAIKFISDINSLNGIANLIGHDYYTHIHSIKVAWLMAAFINFNRDLFDAKNDRDLEELLVQATVAGLLHDIGKIKIPQNILNKKKKLNNIEYLVIQSHTAYSISILFDTPLSKESMAAILYHHENEDGSGYPKGLQQEQIPAIAKICHIADVFDALTSKRHYKESKTPFEAIEIMTGENPYLDTLKKFEREVKENKSAPVTAIVRDDYDIRLRQLRERQMVEEEAEKRVEARIKLRDKGMAHCFDSILLKRFIHMLHQSDRFNLSEQT